LPRIRLFFAQSIKILGNIRDIDSSVMALPYDLTRIEFVLRANDMKMRIYGWNEMGLEYEAAMNLRKSRYVGFCVSKKVTR
jgi:hypothetical protein